MGVRILAEQLHSLEVKHGFAQSSKRLFEAEDFAKNTNPFVVQLNSKYALDLFTLEATYKRSICNEVVEA